MPQGTHENPWEPWTALMWRSKFCFHTNSLWHSSQTKLSFFGSKLAIMFDSVMLCVEESSFDVDSLTANSRLMPGRPAALSYPNRADLRESTLFQRSDWLIYFEIIVFREPQVFIIISGKNTLFDYYFQENAHFS